MTSSNYSYDMRLSLARSNGSEWPHTEISVMLKSLCKKFVFQLEQGESGYKHYQIRCSLIKKSTKATVLDQICKILKCELCDAPQYIAPTSKDVHNGKNFNYVLKEATKIDGPWTENDSDSEEKKEPEYIPRQYRDLMGKLYPYQRVVYDSADEFDPRSINVIVDRQGNNGKSTIASLCELHGRGFDVPPVNDMKELVQLVCDVAIAKKTRVLSPLLVDMPRSMDKKKLTGFYAALEQIKKGKLYDVRYNYRDYWIDSPQIWVFTNKDPDLTMLSSDRWKLWSLNEKRELVEYVPNVNESEN